MQEFTENTPSDQLFAAVARIVDHAGLADRAKKEDFDSPLGGRAAFRKNVGRALKSTSDALILANKKVGELSYEFVTQPAVRINPEFAQGCLIQALNELTFREMSEVAEIRSTVMELLTDRLGFLLSLSDAAELLLKMKAAADAKAFAAAHPEASG